MRNAIRSICDNMMGTIHIAVDAHSDTRNPSNRINVAQNQFKTEFTKSQPNNTTHVSTQTHEREKEREERERERKKEREREREI